MSGSAENLYELFRNRFPADRGRLFLETATGGRWSYAELDEYTARGARFLREHGVAKGDRVAAQVDKSPEALMLYLSCLRAGAVYLPLNTAYQKNELEYFFQDAEPTVVVSRPESLGVVQSVAERTGVTHVYSLDAHGRGSLSQGVLDTDADFTSIPCDGDDLAAVLYTSGTTGRPKGAMLSHRNLASNASTLHALWGFEANDVLLHALPIFHVHGLFVACHCVLLNGTAMIFLPKFDARTVMEFLPRSTVFMGVPTFYTRLLSQADFDASVCRKMRLFISGSAPLLEQTFNEFEARTGHTILERYGMSETAMNTSNPLHGVRKPGTVGLPLPDVSVRVVDDAGESVASGEVGHIEVKGPNVFAGYWRLPEKTAEDFTADGYFRSGDLGRFEEDGYLCIVGRDKDLVITGGYNVYPKEVELVIDQIDGVNESAVIGLPHPDFGEMVTAVVVRKTGHENLTVETITNRLKSQIANYKVPKRVIFAEELPRNTMGKVQKNVLRESCTGSTI